MESAGKLSYYGQFMMKKVKKSQKGFALITVIVFSAIMLIVAGSVYFLLTKGTRFSGEYRTYANIKEASDGGISIATQMLDRVNPNIDYAINFGSLVIDTVETDALPSSACGGSLDDYIYTVPASDGTCIAAVTKNPWISYTVGEYTVDVYIRKEYKGSIAGSGGSASFPPKQGAMPNSEYLIKIVSRAQEATSNAIVTTEGLYRLVR